MMRDHHKCNELIDQTEKGEFCTKNLIMMRQGAKERKIGKLCMQHFMS